MKKLLTSANRPELGFFQDMLAKVEIVTEIRNENSFENLPGACFLPELWLLNDTDYERALILLSELQNPEGESDKWTCTGCGETSEGQFGSCWRCGSVRP